MAATLCPNMKSREWKLLVEEEGDARKAYNVWINNNYDYPEHILSQTNAKIEIEGAYDYQPDPKILNKGRIIDKAIAVLNKKTKRLAFLAQKNPNISEGLVELTHLTNELQRLESDAAILEFTKAADRMTNSALRWIEDMESGKKPMRLENLARIEDYSQAFDILKEIQKDSIGDKDLQEELKLIDAVLGKRNQIKRKYITLSKKILAEIWAPGFVKIEAFYKLKAEREFLKDNYLKGEEKKRAKEEFIKQYMLDNAFIIQLETEEYIQKLLTRTEDIPYLTSTMVNPKDINNPVLSFAVELLDKADYTIMQSLIEETRKVDELYQNYVKFIGKKNNPSELYAPLLEKDEAGNLTGYYVNTTSPNNQLKDLVSGKYKGTPVEALYNYILSVQEKKDEMVPEGAKLGYKIPSINKSTLERIYSSGVITAAKEGFIDAFKIRAEDTEFGNTEKRAENSKVNETIEVITDESGEERQSVPIHFRGKVEPKDKSYDILTISLLDLQNTLNFKEKTEIGITLDVLKENIADADVVQRTFTKNILKVEKGTGEEVVKKGIHSKLYKNLEDIVRHRVYGIGIEGDPKVIKGMNSFNTYVSYAGLGLNYLAAGANLTQGTLTAWIETAGGKSGAYGVKDINAAYAKYTKDLSSIVKDMGVHVPQSKTNMLGELFHAHSNWNLRDKPFIESDAFKRLAGPSTLHGLNNMIEHNLQSIIMYATLSNIKVKDSEGNFLDNKFQPTKDRNKAIGLDEAYSVIDRELKLNPVVASTEITAGMSKDDQFKISRYVRRINRDLFGNYDSKNKAMAQRTILGHLVYSMRGWLIPGVQKRWRGIGKVGIKAEDLTLEQLSYNDEKQAFEEGQYVTAIRFLKQLAVETKGIKMYLVPENWNKLTDVEKGNVKKTLTEVTMIIMFFMLASAAKKAWEDDDKKDMTTLLAAYYSRRLFSELFTFANPKEGLRTFKTPAIALNSAEDIIEFLGQTIDYDEQYTTGKRKGEYKLKKKFDDLVPVVKQMDRDVETSLLYLEK